MGADLRHREHNLLQFSVLTNNLVGGEKESYRGKEGGRKGGKEGGREEEGGEGGREGVGWEGGREGSYREGGRGLEMRLDLYCTYFSSN